MAAPQWGQWSGVLGVRGVLGFMVSFAFGWGGVGGDVSGGAEDGLEFAEDHYDQAGRVRGEEGANGVAGDLFGLLGTHSMPKNGAFISMAWHLRLT